MALLGDFMQRSRQPGGLLSDEGMTTLAGMLTQLPTLRGLDNPLAGMSAPLLRQAQRMRDERRQQDRAQQVRGLLGSAPQELAGPTQSGTPLAGGGSGLLGGEIGPAEFYGELMAVPGYETMGMKGLLAMTGAETSAPASVREFQYYQGLSPEEQARFMALRRGSQFQNLGDRVLQYGPDGQPVAAFPIALSPSQRPEVVAEQSAARVAGQRQAETASELPSTIASAEQTLSLIDEAIQHPGREAATGSSAWLNPANFFPGSEARNFRALADQLQGKVFLQAFESLKGGGQITEVEAQKAEAALARLDRSQSDEAYLKSLQDLREVIQSGLERARSGAGGDWSGSVGNPQTRRFRYNPQTGEFE